jgi:hypothetical protein
MLFEDRLDEALDILEDIRDELRMIRRKLETTDPTLVDKIIKWNSEVKRLNRKRRR